MKSPFNISVLLLLLASEPLLIMGRLFILQQSKLPFIREPGACGFFEVTAVKAIVKNTGRLISTYVNRGSEMSNALQRSPFMEGMDEADIRYIERKLSTLRNSLRGPTTISKRKSAGPNDVIITCVSGASLNIKRSNPPEIQMSRAHLSGIRKGETLDINAYKENNNDFSHPRSPAFRLIALGPTLQQIVNPPAAANSWTRRAPAAVLRMPPHERSQTAELPMIFVLIASANRPPKAKRPSRFGIKGLFGKSSGNAGAPPVAAPGGSAAGRPPTRPPTQGRLPTPPALHEPPPYIGTPPYIETPETPETPPPAYSGYRQWERKRRHVRPQD